MITYELDWLEKWAGYSPIKTAVKDQATGATISYYDLNNTANRLAAYFIGELGLSPGDRVAVLADYSIAYIALFGAVQKSGLIMVPLNYRLTGREIDYMVGNCTPKVMIVADSYLEKMAGQPHFDAVDHPLSMQNIEAMVAHVQSSNAVYSFRNPPLTPDHPLFIIYTSGTTGFPKGAIYTHQMAFWNSINTQLRLDLTAADHTVICMPPFHTGGWNVLLTPLLHHGGSFTLMQKFDADQVLQSLEQDEATLFMAVPTMLKMMAESSHFNKVAFEPLRYFIVGGEAMPVPLIKLWQEKGIPVRQGFGLTEAGPNITSLHHDDAIRKIGSIGKPNFYVQTKLIGPDGKTVGPNTEGELLIAGPMVTPGYWQQSEATAKAFTDGWFHTGDILVQDDEGYLYVRDRIKNMYISGGENVYPAEVEKYLQLHADIDEVVVYGVPDERWGEVGKALVVTKNPSLTEAAVLEFCQGNLAKYKIPKYVSFVDSLPKTDTGKIDRKKVKG